MTWATLSRSASPGQIALAVAIALFLAVVLVIPVATVMVEARAAAGSWFLTALTLVLICVNAPVSRLMVNNSAAVVGEPRKSSTER